MRGTIFSFGVFELDEGRRELRRSGNAIALEPKPLELLIHLVRHSDRVVPKGELMDALWPKTAVTEASLAFAVKQVRKSLGDDARAPHFIRTQWGRGYRFVASIDQPERALARSVEAHELAVLPLECLSDDPEQSYFADGITEDLTDELGKIRALRVASHRSVMRFKGSTHALPAIVDELGVDTVIEGSVRRAGERVRINIRLIDAQSDHQLWNDSFDEDLRDILALQSRIARSVASRVQVTLAPGELALLERTSSVVPAAYDAYLRALNLDRTQRFWAAPAMVPLLERATELDPNFASALTALARAYYMTVAIPNGLPSKYMPKARDCATRAVELGAIEAENTLGAVATYYDWDFAVGLEHYQRVIDARPYTPDAGLAHLSLGAFRCARGDRDTGMAQIREGIDLDPSNLGMHALLCDFHARMRRYDTAIEEAEALVAINPEIPQAHLALFRAHWWRGDIKKAIAAREPMFRAFGLDPGHYPDVSSEADFRDYMRVAIEEWSQRWQTLGVGAFITAHYCAYLGEADETFLWLERAYQVREPEMLFGFNMYPCFDPVRDDPRFAGLASRIGIPIVEPDGPLVRAPRGDA